MISQGGLSLSNRELEIYRVVEAFTRDHLTREAAIGKLGMSPRTFSRKLKAFRASGIEGLVHGNKGRIPTNKKSDETKQWYVSLYKERYFDFNFRHALDFIRERHEVPEPVSYDVFVGWLREAKLGKVKRRRASKARRQRDRRANEGLMLQLDGSPHRYNGKDVWTLIHLIDDATSKLFGAELHPSETTFACMKVLRKVIEQYGIPEFLLTDRAGWSARIGKRAHFSQFERACNELGITIISTSSAPSKGRVERSFRTAQDRLPPELRLKGIKTMEEANRYLEQEFTPRWNEQFSVEPSSPTTRFRPVPAHIDLDDVFCIKQTRLVNRDHTVHIEGAKYKLTEPPKNLWKHEVTVIKDESGKLRFLYGPHELAYEKVAPVRRPHLKAG